MLEHKVIDSNCRCNNAKAEVITQHVQIQSEYSAFKNRSGVLRRHGKLQEQSKRMLWTPTIYVNVQKHMSNAQIVQRQRHLLRKQAPLKCSLLISIHVVLRSCSGKGAHNTWVEEGPESFHPEFLGKRVAMFQARCWHEC